MKSCPTPPVDRLRRAFTLVEVLAAMLVMAIVIPVALQGMSVASRAGVLGTRKATAMRVAERVLNELYVTGQLNQSASSGSITENDTAYPWAMKSETWSQDAMTQVTVTVTFTVQGRDYAVSASTLFDPVALGTTTGTLPL
ncbi:MAG: type II secretion system protein J [Opitutales bacterium]